MQQSRVRARDAEAISAGHVYEVWFRGVHSDIGAGNKNIGLTSIALHWIYYQTLGCDLVILQQEALKQRQNMKPNSQFPKASTLLPTTTERSLGPMPLTKI